MINHFSNIFSVIPSKHSKRILRIRRGLYALFGAIIHTGICFLLWINDLFRTSTLEFLVLFFVFWVGHIGFFIMLSTNKKHLKKRNLTVAIMLWAITCIMYTVFLTNDLRAVLLMLYLLSLVFGAFSLYWRDYIVINVYGLMLYLSIIIYFNQFLPEYIKFNKELAVYSCYVLMSFTFSIICYEMSVVRRYLKRKNKKLEAAFQYIESISITDELTKIKNRRYILSVLENQKLMVERGNYIFSICMIDIDHFKNINDIHSHMIGDKILKNLCKKISANIRKIDSFARYGGEEFLLVLPLTNGSRAKLSADRLRNLIETSDFSDIVPNLKITLSIGVTEYRWPEEIEATIARVDAALYEAKRAGRNLVVLN